MADTSSDEDDFLSAPQSPSSMPFSSPSFFSLIANIFLAAKICQSCHQSPIVAGLPPLNLPEKPRIISSRRRARISDRIQQKKDSVEMLLPLAPPALGECSRMAVSLTVDRAVRRSSMDVGIVVASSNLRRRAHRVSSLDDADCHPAASVPLAGNAIEQDEDAIACLQKRRRIVSNIDRDDSQEAVLPQVQALPGECMEEREISSLLIPLPMTASQLGNISSSCADYERNEDEFVADTEEEVTSARRNGDVDLDYQLEAQTDWLQEGVDEDNVDGVQVYRMPEEQYSTSLFWPIGLAVAAVRFQVNLVAQGFSLIVSLFDWCSSFAASGIRETLQVKNRATEAVSQKITMISKVPPKITESGSIVLKRAGWGCLAATCVCLLLSMLLFPALLLDFIFLNTIVEEPVSIREPLHFDYTQPHPSAIVSLRPQQREGSSRGKLVRRPDNVRAIPFSHRVHITVILTVPESDYNRNLGMFQITAELLSENGEVIKVSRRPCMLRFHSAPIRLAKTFLVGLPSLMGMFSESQKLVIHLMEFEEQHVPSSAVRIVLQPKAGMPLGAGIPEIYYAEVHIQSQLPWLKDLVRRWKWTFYIWTGLVLYILEIIMVLCCCRQALLPKTWVGQSKEASFDSGNVTVTDTSVGGSHERQMPQRHHLGRRCAPFDEQIPIARVFSSSGESISKKFGAVSRSEPPMRQRDFHAS